MMTPVLCCGFECGGTKHGNSTAGTGSTIVTSFKRTGDRAMRYNASNASVTPYSWQPPSGTYTRVVMRFFVYFAVLPNVDTALAYAGGTNGPRVHYIASTSKIHATILTSSSVFTHGATGVTVEAERWYCIDCDLNIQTAGNDVADVRVDGVACGQATDTGVSAAQSSFNLGLAAVGLTGDVYFDDVIFSNTAADYPIGPGKVIAFVPNADGTHTATTTTIVKGTAATPVGANVAGSTDVFNWVNARPIGGGATDATRLVNQQTAGATLYAEVDFEPTTEVNPPRAVEVITGEQQAATATCNFITKLNDNGTEADVANSGTRAGVVTDRFTAKQFATMPSGGAAWTLARFNALKARYGYSSDATPDVYWRGIMIEAEFPESLDASAFGRPDGQAGQSQMHQLLAQ